MNYKSSMLVSLFVCLSAVVSGADLVTMEADVVVVGGSSAGVAAACAAADHGAKVFLVAPRPYLGDDICGKQHFWLEAGEKPESEIAKSLFPDCRVTTPLIVKKALDKALIRRGVKFLTGCYVSELLVDEKRLASGVVIVNRSGSQAIKAKVIVDASSHAVVARLAGAKFREFVPGEKEFKFIVVGGVLKSGAGFSGRVLDVTYKNPGKSKTAEPFPVFEYTAMLALKENTYADYSKSEQVIRNMVCGAGMVDCSEFAICLPVDTVIGEQRIGGEWSGAAKCDDGVFRPKGICRLYVLSEYADLSAKAQAAVIRPLEFLLVGEVIGRAAALEAKNVTIAGEVGVTDIAGVAVEMTENAGGMNPKAVAGSVKVGKRTFPVIGQYDVVVVGGGTSGAPAGIGAARGGARTLVVEYLDELGGVGTAGMIGEYWYGVSGGFTKEINEGIGYKGKKWDVVPKSEWLRREILKSGGDLWFGSSGCGAVVEKGKVVGVVVATPYGCGVVLARTVVDATGNSDIAACAGAETQFSVSPDGMLSVQMAGFPDRNLGDNYNNSAITMVDDTSVRDIWHLMTWSRAKADTAKSYDIGQLLDSRERRRIVADYMLTTMDILNKRTFPDTISQHRSNFDAAAFPTAAMLLVKDMKGPAFNVDMPYRSLLPKGVDGILVIGLGAGAERDAMTLVRMQPDLQNQGFAAGAAAAMATANGGHTRDLDIKKLQKQLIDKGVLAEKVYADKDSYPMSREAIQAAVIDVGSMRSEIKQVRTVEDKAIFSLAAIMAHPDKAVPLLRKAYGETADKDAKLNYAKILGMLGDQTGAATLAAAVNEFKAWDKGFALTGDREKNNTFSVLDRLVIALGYSGAPGGLEAIVAKAGQLDANSELSHYNAVSMALRHYAQPDSAIVPLVRLLSEPGFTGHAVVDDISAKQNAGDERSIVPRKLAADLNAAFRELIVAGMLVQCGDSEHMGRNILEEYSKDVQGHFARYSQYLLQSAEKADNAK